MEQAAAAVIHQQGSKAGLSIHESLYTFDGFKREFGASVFGGLELSNLDVKVLVKYLERDKHAVIVQRGVSAFRLHARMSLTYYVLSDH